MSPRIRQERPMSDPVVEREMRELHTRLDAMETSQRKAHDFGDVSDAENKEVEVEKVVVGDVAEERLLKVVVKLGARAKIDIPMYEGNLYGE